MRASTQDTKTGVRASTHPTPGIGTVRWPRIVPKDPDCAESLKKRTLTNLYNERPTWLDLAHTKLDAAVFAAYDWNPAMGDEELLENLLELNLARAGGSKEGKRQEGKGRNDGLRGNGIESSRKREGTKARKRSGKRV